MSEVKCNDQIKNEYRIINGDCRIILPTLESNSVDCVVTSPPYWGLRDYNVDGQIGLEDTMETYIKTLTAVSSEIYRVLKPEGTYWLNLGDKYATSCLSGQGDPTSGKKPKGAFVPFPRKTDLPNKCLMMLPERVAISLISSGWILRNKIIWAKTNPMPSSAIDRFTSSHEMIYFFTKKAKGYYFNQEAVKEPAVTIKKRSPAGSKGTLECPNSGLRDAFSGKTCSNKISKSYSGNGYEIKPPRNRWDVWNLATAGSERVDVVDAIHYAKFPQSLVRLCLLAGCPENGIVLDPFSGSGTTGKVAIELGCKYVGIELNPVYAVSSERKLELNEDGVSMRYQSFDPTCMSVSHKVEDV